MFWRKKEPCFHEWKVSDFRVAYGMMSDIDNVYDITCVKCFKKRNVDEYEFNQMKTKGFITQ